MRERVHVLQLPDRDLGVDLGGGQLAMAEDGLDVTDVGAVVEHQRRHRVAEDVAGPGLFDAGLFDRFLYPVGEPVLAEGLAIFM